MAKKPSPPERSQEEKNYGSVVVAMMSLSQIKLDGFIHPVELADMKTNLAHWEAKLRKHLNEQGIKTPNIERLLK
jgi:hypothetical protein